MVTREQLLKECQNEPPAKPRCARCQGCGRVSISVGGGCMGYDDEETTCPTCHGSGTTWLKEILEGARESIEIRKLSNSCSRCGASLCVEEYHECDREYEWQRTHG